MKQFSFAKVVILILVDFSLLGCEIGMNTSTSVPTTVTGANVRERPILTSNPSISTVLTYSLPSPPLVIGNWKRVESSSATVNEEKITSYSESQISYMEDNTFERTEHNIVFRSDDSIVNEDFFGYRGIWSLTGDLLTETTNQARHSTTGPFPNKDSGWLTAADQLADKNSWPKLPYSGTDNILIVNGRLFHQVLISDTTNGSIVGTWSSLRDYWSPNESQTEYKTQTYYRSVYEYQSDGKLISRYFTSKNLAFSSTPDLADTNHYVDNGNGTLTIQSDGEIVHFAIADGKYLILGTESSLDGKSYRRE